MTTPTSPLHDHARWHCRWRVERWHPDGRRDAQDGEGNILTATGANALALALTGGASTAFNGGNARIGVGDGGGSVPTVSAGDTDLTAATNKARVAVDGTYPQVAGGAMTFRSTFDGATANFAWNEFGIFNAATGGVMLNHKGQALGTKVSGAVWQLTVTITLS